MGHIEMLALSAPVMGRIETVHPVLLWDEHGAILADTGYPRQLPQLREALAQFGVSFADLRTVILTHQDIDHIGNIAELAQQLSGQLEIWAHEADKPYIQGERMLLKVTPEALARIDALPDSVPPEWRQALKSLLQNPPKAQVDKTLTDGQVLPYCGGITVIHTPGHTPGHISLYHQPSRTLIAGDELLVLEGELQLTQPSVTYDMTAARESVRKLAPFDIASVICYHGGRYEGDANRRIAELARG